MQTLSSRSLIIVVAIAAVAGCSGNTPAVAPTSSLVRSRMPILPQMLPVAPELRRAPVGWPKKKNAPILFAADGPSGILMFDPNTPNASSEGSITDGIYGAAGLAVDTKSTLYVANISNNTVTVYPRGATSPKYTINTGLSWPYGIDLDSKGNIFVSNIYSDTLTAYHSGDISPYETIEFDTYGAVMGVAVDGKDNVWVVSDYGPPYLVFEIPAGTTQVNDAGLEDLNVPIGIAFGQNDEMYVSNLESSIVNVYKYGATKPFRTITNGIEHYGATMNAVTATGLYFQANQVENVVGYKQGKSSPFSTLDVTEPLGLASWPLVKK